MSALEIGIVVVAILLMMVILLQQRAVGLGGAFGGGTSVFTTRRGPEKSLYRLTVVLTIVFVALTLFHLTTARPTSSQNSEATDIESVTASPADAGEGEAASE